MSSYSTPFAFTLLLCLSTITPSCSARILLSAANPPQTSHQPTQPSITFIMPDIHPSINNNNPQQQQLLPFAKPLTAFPLTYGEIPLPYQNSRNKRKTPAQPLDTPKFGIAFTATTKNLQEEMEFGLVTTIEEEIYDEDSTFGTAKMLGKSRGVYVAMNSTSSEDGIDNSNSHMMAMTVTFTSDLNAEDDEDSNDDEVDRLKLFGAHRKDVMECHVAVIGGTGKFKDANGFAVIKPVLSSNMLLLYNVYLS